MRNNNGRFESLPDSSIQFIKDYYPSMGNSFCAKSLKLNKSTISRYVKKLGLKVTKWDAPEGFKICYRCKETLPINSFYPKAILKTTKTDACKNCQKTYRKEREDRLKQTLDGRKSLTADNLLANSRMRAKELALPHQLDKAWILENLSDSCEILKTPFVFCDGETKDESPSIDRVIPSLGYTKENSRIISQRANRIKNDASVEELEAILTYLKTNLQK